MKTAFHTTLNGLLFKAAKASSPDGFYEAVEEMKALHTPAANYVLNHGVPNQKYDSHFSCIGTTWHISQKNATRLFGPLLQSER